MAVLVLDQDPVFSVYAHVDIAARVARNTSARQTHAITTEFARQTATATSAPAREGLWDRSANYATCAAATRVKMEDSALPMG